MLLIVDCKFLSSKDGELLTIILHFTYSQWIGRLARQCVGLKHRRQVTESYSCHPFCSSDSVKIEEQLRFKSSFYSSILWRLCDSYHSFHYMCYILIVCWKMHANAKTPNKNCTNWKTVELSILLIEKCIH